MRDNWVIEPKAVVRVILSFQPMESLQAPFFSIDSLESFIAIASGVVEIDCRLTRRLAGVPEVPNLLRPFFGRCLQV